jgi:patatin-like phospholipase/acyl hydrolase
MLINYRVVLAVTKDNVIARPTLFTTYDTSARFRGCKIWQVARATSAATTFFKPISVGRDEIEFVDAALGYNNPCEVLVDEARRIFPTRNQLHILSIGTGTPHHVAIGDTRMEIIDALKAMATSAKQVAFRMDGLYGDSRQYFRFNVDRGLEDITLADWRLSSQISTHTHNYLTEQRRAISNYVQQAISDFPPPVLQDTNEAAVSSEASQRS